MDATFSVNDRSGVISAVAKPRAEVRALVTQGSSQSRRRCVLSVIRSSACRHWLVLTLKHLQMTSVENYIDQQQRKVCDRVEVWAATGGEVWRQYINGRSNIGIRAALAPAGMMSPASDWIGCEKVSDP